MYYILLLYWSQLTVDLECQYKFKLITVISVLYICMYIHTAKFYRFIEGRSYSTIILSFESSKAPQLIIIFIGMVH